jgi:hypothetical protein
MQVAVAPFAINGDTELIERRACTHETQDAV